MDIKHVMEYYKPRQLTPAELKEHVKLHVDIEIDVNLVKEMIGNEEEDKLNNYVENMRDEIGGFSACKPEKRTRQQMVWFIAALEYIAGNYRDEIADGAYNE